MISTMFYWGWKFRDAWPRGEVIGSMDRLVIVCLDAQGDRTHTTVHIDSAATAAEIQAYVDAMQAMSRGSIVMTERIVTTVNASAGAATPYNATTAPYASNSVAAKLAWSAGVSSPRTYNSLFAPLETDVTTDLDGNLILDMVGAHGAALLAAAQAVMRNDINQVVVSSLSSKLHIRPIPGA